MSLAVLLASPSYCCLVGQPLTVAVFAASPSCCCLVDQPLTVAVFVSQPQPLLPFWPAQAAPFWRYLSCWAVQFRSWLVRVPLVELVRLLHAFQISAWWPATLPLAVSSPFDQVVKLGPLVLAVKDVFHIVLLLTVYLQWRRGSSTSLCVLFAGSSSKMWNTGCILSLGGSSSR